MKMWSGVSECGLLHMGTDDQCAFYGRLASFDVKRKHHVSEHQEECVHTTAGTFLAWLLVRAAVDSWWTVMVFILAVAGVFAHNTRIIMFALRLAT